MDGISNYLLSTYGYSEALTMSILLSVLIICAVGTLYYWLTLSPEKVKDEVGHECDGMSPEMKEAISQLNQAVEESRRARQ